MPQVDFYILHTQNQNQNQNQNRYAKDRLTCQLTDKAWHQGYRIYIQTPSLVYAQQFDNYLWTFKEESFLPHDIYPEMPESLAPIRIGYSIQVCKDMDVLINLTETVPPFFALFQRIAEIVDDTPYAKQAGRNRYRFYRDKAYPLKVHDIHR